MYLILLEDWVVDFPTRYPDPSDKWDINIDADGVVTYLRQDRASQDPTLRETTALNN